MIRFSALCLSLLAPVLLTAAQAQAPAGHDAAAHAGTGLKKELFAGVTEADFLKLGSEPKSVKVVLVAAYTDANYGMNFDGYSHGKAVFTIPVGWKVDVSFINPSPVPHSVVVVEKDTVRKLQMGDPVFEGAATPNPATGISGAKAEFKFTASEGGDYAFACGFPSHALAGHWVSLVVSADAKAPSLKLGDGPEKEVK